MSGFQARRKERPRVRSSHFNSGGQEPIPEPSTTSLHHSPGRYGFKHVAPPQSAHMAAAPPVDNRMPHQDDEFCRFYHQPAVLAQPKPMKAMSAVPLSLETRRLLQEVENIKARSKRERREEKEEQRAHEEFARHLSDQMSSKSSAIVHSRRPRRHEKENFSSVASTLDGVASYSSWTQDADGVAKRRKAKKEKVKMEDKATSPVKRKSPTEFDHSETAPAAKSPRLEVQEIGIQTEARQIRWKPPTVEKRVDRARTQHRNVFVKKATPASRSRAVSAEAVSFSEPAPPPRPRRAKSEEQKEKTRNRQKEELEKECRQSAREKRMSYKPWRKNMRSNEEKRKDKEEAETAEDQKDGGRNNRPWRSGMKKVSTEEETNPNEALAGRLLFPSATAADREKVRQFMQRKRDVAKASLKRQENEIEQRKEVVKQRLLALEMKRREAYKTQLVERRRNGAKDKASSATSPKFERQKKSSEEIQLRKKLEELTAEMRRNRFLLVEKNGHGQNDNEFGQEKDKTGFEIRAGNKNVAEKQSPPKAPIAQNFVEEKEVMKMPEKKPSSPLKRSNPPSAEKKTLFTRRSQLQRQQQSAEKTEQPAKQQQHQLDPEQLRSQLKAELQRDWQKEVKEQVQKQFQEELQRQLQEHLEEQQGQKREMSPKPVPQQQQRKNPVPREAVNDDVPVRDPGSSVPQGSDRLKKIVSEIFTKQQNDLDYMRNSKLGISLPQPQQLLQRFNERQQQSDDDAAPLVLHRAESPDPDPFNFISTVRRKLLLEQEAMEKRDREKLEEKQSQKKKQKEKKKAKADNTLDMIPVSEGPLSTSMASSATSVNGGTTTPAGGESEAVTKEELLQQFKERKKRATKKKRAYAGQQSKDTTFDGARGEGRNQPMLRPEALRMRFQTEVQQLETVHGVEQHLDRIAHAKLVHDAKNKNTAMAEYIENLKASLSKAKQAKKSETRAEFETRMRIEFQSLITSRMERLMQEQTDATRVTADAAMQLAALQRAREQENAAAALVGDRSVKIVDEVNVSELANAIRREEVAKNQNVPKETVVETKKSAKAEEKSKLKVPQPQSIASSSGVIATDPQLSKELQTLISRTESSAPEIISAIEGSKSLSKTISEALENLGYEEGDLSASNNVTEDIATDYSSKFEEVDSGTIKAVIVFEEKEEVSSEIKTASSVTSQRQQQNKKETLLPAKRSESAASKSKSSYQYEEDFEDAEESKSRMEETSLRSELSEDNASSISRLLAPSTSTLSLFSPSDSFGRFTLQMYQQQLEKESLRARHQYDLLKKREVNLVSKAKAEISSLKERKKSLKNEPDQLDLIKKRERAVLSELKKRRGEIDRLKQGIKVAESERKLLLQQQKKLMVDEERDDTTTSQSRTVSETNTTLEGDQDEDSETRTATTTSSMSASVAKEVKTAEKQIMRGIKMLERNKHFLSEKETKVLDRTKDLGKLFQRKDESDDEEGKTESDPASAVTVTSPSKMENLRKSLGTLKTPLSPKMQRRRNSSGGGAESDDSLSVSQAETVSDHSDVEIRIHTLHDELQRRMQTAARLKRQAKSKSKEKLRGQEVALKKQIEKYDKLIQETQADLEDPAAAAAGSVAAAAGPVVQPQIKTPYMQLEKPIAGGTSRKASMESMTDTSYSLSAPPSPLPSKDTVPPFPVQDKPPVTPEVTSLIEDMTEDILTEEVEEVMVEESEEEIEESTKKESLVKVKGAKKDFEQHHSDLNYSDDFTSSSEDNVEPPQVITATIEEKKKAAVLVPKKDSVPAVVEKKVPEEKKVVAPVKKKKDKDQRSDEISEEIMTDLISDTCSSYKEVMKAVSDESKEASPIMVVKTQPKKPSSPSSPSGLSPRSRPQDLMLSTFDISSESSDEDRIAPMMIKQMIPVVDLDRGESEDDCEGNFIDDDFGLGGINIDQESEQLKRQQQLIEEEISRIQKESSSVVKPDKPPPPYSPPSPAAKVSKAQVKKTERYVPSSKEEIEKIVAEIAEQVYKMKAEQKSESDKKAEILQDLQKQTVNKDSSYSTFLSFLLDLVFEIAVDIFRCEKEEQNPPWMPQKALAKARRGLPRSAESLSDRACKQALVLFGYESRAQRENLVVRWSQKRRDRVDAILVRELHAEESGWTDYAADEALVKDQLADSLMALLLDDTARELVAVMRK